MNDEQNTLALNDPKAIFASTAMGTAAIIMFLLLPLLVGAVAETIDTTPRQLGILASSDLFGFGMGSLVGLFWARKVNWRSAGLVLLVALLITNLFSISVAENITTLSTSRLLSGIVQGSLCAIYSAHISDTLKPERYYAYFLAAQTAAGGIGLLLLPNFIGGWGVAAVIAGQIILTALSLVLVALWMPRGGFSRVTAEGHSIAINWKLTLPALMGLVAFFVAQGGVWAYMERIGNSQGLSAQFVGIVLSVAMGGSFIGSLIASAVDLRFGKKSPLILAAVFQVVCLIIIFSDLGRWTYFAAGFLFCTLWNFALPYMIGVLIEVDASGRTILAGNPTFALGVAIAPLVISSFVTHDNYISVSYLASLAILLSLGLFLWVIARATVQASK